MKTTKTGIPAFRKPLDPDQTIALGRKGGVLPYGNPSTTHKILVNDPEGFAELGELNGFGKNLNNGTFQCNDGSIIPNEEVFPRFEREFRETAGSRLLDPVPQVCEKNKSEILDRAEALGLIQKNGDQVVIKETGEVLDPGTAKNPNSVAAEVARRFLYRLYRADPKGFVSLAYNFQSVWGGQRPSGMQNLPALMGMEDRKAIKETTYAGAATTLQAAPLGPWMALYSSADALAEGAINLEEIFGEATREFGYSINQGEPGPEEKTRAIEGFQKEGFLGRGQRNGISPFTMPFMLMNASGRTVGQVDGPRDDEGFIRVFGKHFAVSAECATYTLGLCLSADTILGHSRTITPTHAMLVGASEATHGLAHNRYGTLAFDMMGAKEGIIALLERMSDPMGFWEILMPLLEDGGFHSSEGATAGLVWRFSKAIESGAPLSGTLDGWAYGGDQATSTPSMMGDGGYFVVRDAIKMAARHGWTPQNIDLINIHGTQTPQSNRKELKTYAQALISLIEEWAGEIASQTGGSRKAIISALKSKILHLLGAAGGAELAILLESIERQIFATLPNWDGKRSILAQPKYAKAFQLQREPYRGLVRRVVDAKFGFHGCDAAIAIGAMPSNPQYRDISNEVLADHGYDEHGRAAYWGKVDHRLGLRDEIRDMIRSGRITWREALEWFSFRSAPTRMQKGSLLTGYTAAQARNAGELSPGASQVSDLLRKVTFSIDGWVDRALEVIERVLTSVNDSGTFTPILQKIADVRARTADASLTFVESGLPSVIPALTRRSNILEILAANPAVLESLQDVLEPKQIEAPKYPKVKTDAAIPLDQKAVALVFPGQGRFDDKSAREAKQLYETNPTYRRVIDEIHGRLKAFDYDLKSFLLAGTDDDLNLTEHQQPVSIADLIARGILAQERLQARGVKVVATIGDSLGEVVAAFFAGHFASPGDAGVFAFIRGREMQGVAPFGETGLPMAQVSGLPEDVMRGIVTEVNDRFKVHVIVSKRNAVGALVLSGEPAAVKLAGRRITALGGKFQKISVTSPFHDPKYYTPEVLKTILDEARTSVNSERRYAGVRVISNSTKKPISDDAEILPFLVGEIAEPVYLPEGIQTAASPEIGVNSFLVIGNADYITGSIGTALGEMANPPSAVHAVTIKKPEDLDAVIPPVTT